MLIGYARAERVKQLCTTCSIIKLHLPFSESGSSLRHSVRTGHRCSLNRVNKDFSGRHLRFRFSLMKRSGCFS